MSWAAMSWAATVFSPPSWMWKPECFQARRSARFPGTDELGVAQGVEEAVAEKLIHGRPTALHACVARHPLARVPVQNPYKPSGFFDGRVEVFSGHAVEMAVAGEEAVGSEDLRPACSAESIIRAAIKVAS
jgi:hypothetical protein